MKKSFAWLFACLMVGTFAGCDDSSSNSDKAECSGTEVKCADGSHTKKCTDGKWSEPVVCPETAAICNESLNKCVACNQGDKECVGEDQIKECKEDGSWGNPVSCQPSTPVCNADQKKCVEGTIITPCTNGEKRCDGENKIQTCAEGSWGTSENCPNATPKCDNNENECVEDTPAQICTPDAKECVGENQIKQCNADGTAWGEPDECKDPTPVCDNIEKKCVSAEEQKICTPNAKECVGQNQIKQCSADGKSWGAPVDCDAATPICDSSNPDDHKCIAECEGTESLCLDKVNIKTCASGKWKIQLCGDENPICDDSLNQCVECTPNTNFCQIEYGGKSGKVFQCTAEGKIGDSIKNCPMGCNESFTDCQGSGDKCKNGNRKCDGTDILVCKDGEWKTDIHNCSNDSVICNDSVGAVCIPSVRGVCQPNETICDKNVLYECVDGLYSKAEPLCDDGSCLKPYCLSTNVTPGMRRAAYAKECKNTSYCNDRTQYFCDAEGNVTSRSCGDDTGGRSSYCVLEGPSAISESPIMSTTCINSNHNFIFTCEGESANILKFYINDSESYELTDCSKYGLTCQDGVNGGCVAASTSDSGSL